ncbi:TPA: TonB-dependent siderophore receptor [Pseudomonas aeruginosa]
MVIQDQGPLHARKNHSLHALACAIALLAIGDGARAASHASADEPADDTASLPSLTITTQATGETTEGSQAYTTNQTSAATGLPLSLRETPQSVTVMTRQRMDDQRLHSIRRVLENTTGISSSTLDSERVSYYSRGFQVTSFQYDGIPTSELPDAFAPGEGALDTAIYDRVEVVRGATGLLNGVGNPSASINLVRKHPLDTFRLHGALEAGSWDTRRSLLDVSAPLSADGRVRGRLVGAYQDGNSFRDYYEQRRQSLYGVMDIDLTEDTLLTFGYDYQNIDPDGITWGGVPLFYSDGSRAHWSRSKTLAARWNSWDSTLKTAFATLEQRFANGWRVRGNLSQKKADSDGDFFSALGYPDRQTGQGLLPVALQSRLDTRQTSLDLMANGPFQLGGREHELVVGAMGSRRTAHDRSTGFIYPGAAMGNIYDWNGYYPKPDFSRFAHAPTDTRVKQAGLYTTARLSLADPLTLIVGGRLSQYEIDQETSTRDFHYERRGKFIPYAGLVYDLDETYSVYASYTEIFNPQLKRDRNGGVLAPTKGRNKEVGIKAEYLEGRLNASLALFETRQDNVAQIDSGHLLPDGTQAYTAASGTKARGFDIDLQGQLTQNWNLSFGLSHFTASDGDGHRLSSEIPRSTARLFSTYRLPGDLERITLGGGVNWQSRFYQEATGPQGAVEVGQKSYALASLMARYRLSDRATLSANLDNLFDRKYVTMAGFYNQYLYGEPRSLIVGVSYTFE